MKSYGFLPKLRWIIPSVAFLGLLGFTIIWWAEVSRGELPTLGTVPQFAMTTSTGQSFGLSEMQGKICIISFMFTSCRSICPTTQKNMAELYRAFASSDKVQLISISVDPDHDTPEVLKAYAGNWGVNDDRWVFLRAPLAEVATFCEKGLMLPAEDLPGGHTAHFTLIDQTGHIRGYYDGMDDAAMKLLKSHIARLVREIS